MSIVGQMLRFKFWEKTSNRKVSFNNCDCNVSCHAVLNHSINTTLLKIYTFFLKSITYAKTFVESNTVFKVSEKLKRILPNIFIKSNPVYVLSYIDVHTDNHVT